MSNGETFARIPSRWSKIGRPRVASLAALAALSLAILAFVLNLNPERTLLLFDLGVGLLMAGVLYFVARRMIRDEAEHRRRLIAAVLSGVAAAAAALGILAVTLAGKPVGLQQLAALLIIQLLGAAAGAGLGLLFGFFVAALVLAARRFVAQRTPTIDGLVIGLLTGLLAGTAASYLPHLGAGFIAASTVVCAICGARSADRFTRLTTSRRTTPKAVVESRAG